MSREQQHLSGGQPISLPKGEMVEVPRRPVVDSCGRLPGAMRAVPVELIDARIRGMMAGAFAVALVVAGFAALLLVAALEVVR